MVGALGVSQWLVRLSYGLEDSVRYGRIKRFFYDLLENPKSAMRPYFDLFMIALVLSSITVMLYDVRADLGVFDDLFEQFAVSVFILEYLLRLWVYSDSHKIIIEHYERAEFVNRPFRIGPALREVLAKKWEYMTRPLAVIDLLAILPSYRPIRLLRLFLLFRLFKLFRYARSLGRFVDVLSEKRYELLTLAIFMAFVVFAAASALYVFEVDDPRSDIHDFFDSLYWSVVTLSTVGYGDITPQTVPGRLITMVLIVAGIGVISFFTSIIVSAFAEKLPEVSAQRVFSELERRAKHTILCGYGRVGQVVAERLARSKQRFVVIDPDEAHVRLAKHRGYLAVQGNAEDNELLESTNIRQARRILCLTGEDVVNVYITLTARQLNPAIEIISRANHRDNEIKLHRAGASYTVAPFDTAGLVAAQYVGQPVAFEAIYGLLTDEESVGTDAVRVQEGSVLDGLTVGEVDFLAFRLILFGVISDATRVSDSAPHFYTLTARRFFFNPGPGFRLKANDLLIVFGHEHSVIHFREHCSRKET